MHFEWDRTKAHANRRKHRVTFDEAVSVFYDPLSATFPDPDSSRATEERLVTVGQSLGDAYWWLSILSRVRQSASSVHV